MSTYLKFFLGAIVIIGFLLSGCTKYATQEQTTSLEDTKKAALAAEDMLKQKVGEREDWEMKVAVKDAELDAKKAEKDEVEQKVGE